MDVSILIPAFRPTFLRQTIASALTQGGDDFRILVSDDSGDDALQPIVETFRDPRIRYVRTPGRTGTAANLNRLWDLCETDRMIFLFDDDLLLPHALAELGAALDETPGAAFAFGRRHVIDAQGRITRELTNVLMDRAAGLTVDDLLRYADLALQVNADVAFYLNATRRGPAVGVGKAVAAFRLHGAQNSSAAFNPKFPFGVVEWELFIRGEHDAGRLPQAQALKAIAKLLAAYATWSQQHPPVAMMTPGLEALADRVRRGETGLVDDAFRSDWAAFADAVRAQPGA